jgi:hypothetical protein
MSDIPFHDTRMGRVFYEVTLPALVRQLERLNENLERMNAKQRPPSQEKDGGTGKTGSAAD